MLKEQRSKSWHTGFLALPLLHLSLRFEDKEAEWENTIREKTPMRENWQPHLPSGGTKPEATAWNRVVSSSQCKKVSQVLWVKNQPGWSQVQHRWGLLKCNTWNFCLSSCTSYLEDFWPCLFNSSVGNGQYFVDQDVFSLVGLMVRQD